MRQLARTLTAHGWAVAAALGAAATFALFLSLS